VLHEALANEARLHALLQLVLCGVLVSGHGVTFT
jgi:hypothetical protein